MDTLPLAWYLEPPIDFEHKQYVLWSYLHRVDQSYLEKRVSPYLLQLERLEQDLLGFGQDLSGMRQGFDRSRYLYFPNPHLEGEELELLDVIQDIVRYSEPQIHSRIETGRIILSRYRQVLF
jgi:hypothetical protein